MLRSFNLASFLVVMLLHISSLSAQEENTVWLAGTNWYPYVYTDKKGNPTGLDYQLLSNVMAQLHYKIGLRPFPEKRLKIRILKGNVDTVLGAAKNSARSENNFFSAPYRTEIITFAFTKSNASEFNDKPLKVLLDEGRLIAFNSGGWYGEWFNREILPNYPRQLIHVDSIERRLHLLTMNRVDLILDDRYAIKANAQLGQVKNLVISPYIVAEQDVHFMFSKHVFTQAFVNDFNKALDQTLKTM